MDESKQFYWIIRSKPFTREGTEVVSVVREINRAEQSVSELTEREQDKDWSYHFERRPRSYPTEPQLATEILQQESEARLTQARKPTKRALKMAKYFRQWEARVANAKTRSRN